MKISTNVRIRFAALLAVILALLIVFKAIGFAVSIFTLIIGIVLIYLYISRQKCPVCGNNLLYKNDAPNRQSASHLSAIIALVSGRCSTCKSKF